MEKVVLYIIIFIGYLIFQGWRATQKKKQNQTGRVKKNSNKPIQQRQSNQESRGGNSPEDLQRKIFKELGLEEYLDSQTENKNTASERKGPNPFIQNEVEKAKKSHFSEERIINEIEKAHSQGKEMEHHTHHYVDEKEFESLENTDMEKVYKIKEVLKDVDGKALVKKKHPILARLSSKKKVKEAILLREIIDRKF